MTDRDALDEIANVFLFYWSWSPDPDEMKDALDEIAGILREHGVIS